VRLHFTLRVFAQDGARMSVFDPNVDRHAWIRACEILRHCFASDEEPSQSARLDHTTAAMREQFDENDVAGLHALLVNLVDLGGGLLLLAADATRRSPEALLDLMFLLAYEEDAEGS
jgi:hypothetical protein